MKKWKVILIVCIIAFVFGIVVENIWVTNDFIWNIGKMIIISSIIVGIVTLIVGTFLTHKKSEKMPIWFYIVISIIMAFVIIFVIGNYYSNKWDKNYNENYNNTKSNTTRIEPSSIKTISPTEF